MYKIRKNIFEVIKMAGIFAAATIVGMIFRYLGFPEPNIVIIYILAVLLTSRFTAGYSYGILSSFISMLGFNYFFTAPYYTLKVYDPGYFITFSVMALTAFITSALTSKEKILAKKAADKELESRILYTLINQLSDVNEIEKVIEIATRSISNLIENDASCIYFGNGNKYIYIQQFGEKQVHRSSDNIDAIKHQLIDLRTEYAEDKSYCNLPINGNERILGAVRISKEVLSSMPENKKKIFHSMIENIAMVLDRMVTFNERMKDREMMIRERYRANLLRAISHDLRTPLSGIMGTSEMLMDMTEKSDKRYELMKGIYKDADWLHTLVENILSLTRLQDGKMVMHKEMEAIEEVIACAVSHIEKSCPGRTIQVELPKEFRLVPMDAKLIEQVLFNLLDNAVKHTSMDEAIKVSVDYDDTNARVTVLDEGEGISKVDEGNIFQMFYTSKTKLADAKNGIGLGLAICETVIKAHGGNIIGRNRDSGKGAEFIFELPLEDGGKIV